jgi:hypothetical protein
VVRSSKVCSVEGKHRFVPIPNTPAVCLLVALLQAAKGAGAFAVGVTTSLPAEALAQWADVVVSDIREVIPLLTGPSQDS